MKNTKKVLAEIIGVMLMFVCVFSLSAIDAQAVTETKRTDYTITNGVTESTVYLTDSEGVNLRAHILRVQKGAGVSFKATVKGYYSSNSTKSSREKKADDWNSKSWGFKLLKGLATDYNNSKKDTGNVIAASNGDFYDGTSYQPLGNLIVEGNALHKSNTEPFFAVQEDGTCDIRSAGSSTSDVQEAIGGSKLLVYDNKNCFSKNGGDAREPRQGIGICDDGTVVIINIDGREPASRGATMYDFAETFREQGCSKAINFDGGGSATFLTKRSGDSKLVYRNTKGDGFERKVSSALLVVADEPKGELTGTARVSMAGNNTVLEKVSGVWRYKVNGKAASGFYAVNGKTYLFSKGKGLTKKIKIGNVTYMFSKGALTKCSDKKAGNVIIGYCGSAKSEQNLIYAYQYGNKVLNVGLNPLYKSKNSGKMKSWTPQKKLELPWYSMRSDIKKVYIGNGVTSIGARFLNVATGKVFDGTPVPKSVLSSVRFPSSLKTIETFAFYNKPKLKNVVIPARVKSIGRNAFAYSGTGYLRFKGTKVPTFGKYALSKTTFKKVYVKNSSAWRKFVKAKKFKKYGYKKTVAYK